ncbi:MAG: zinc ABC transporter substrate-binding protein [Cyanobacteria bacterium SID2]|nr:zinc ABC transporter substrate-binding protein [Cyanobacteria bacterium SID2]MBP0003166.1 zinc ABC transporter substrate-binding protein [Cyanobacteria bacterium SBC]
MKVSHSLATITLVLGIGSIVGCNAPNPNTNASDDETLDVTVSIAPQKYFVEKIGGDNVEVSVMVEPGESPHTYEPKPDRLRALSDAEAYIQIGIDFEKAWMDRIQSANPEMLAIDSTEGIEKISIGEHHHEEHHDDETEEEHSHEEHHDDETEEKHHHDGEMLDPHVWLSPELVKVQAQNIHNALVQLDPENQDEYDANLAAFVRELDELDAQIRQNLANLENRKFLVFHPSWGYFARDYDLQQISIEVGGQEPSASELAQIITEAQADNIKVVFAQPEFSPRSAEFIAREIDGEVLLITPLAPDWSDNLLKVSQTFADVLR